MLVQPLADDMNQRGCYQHGLKRSWQTKGWKLQVVWAYCQEVQHYINLEEFHFSMLCRMPSQNR